MTTQSIAPAPRPRKELTAYVGMVVFLGGWAMMFAGLFFAYGAVRIKAPVWPLDGEPHVPLLLPAINTVIMLLSSVALSQALKAIRGDLPHLLTRWLVRALALGALFLTLQLVVWRRVWLDGTRPDSGIYGSVFYALTVFHALHVLVGLGGLAALLPRAMRGTFSARSHTAVRLWGMFWHFVDAVWLVMFLTVYVM